MMPPRKILVDSSFLYALFDEDEVGHASAVIVAKLYQGRFVLPYVVLTETAYLFNRARGVPGVLKFLVELMKMDAQFEGILEVDLVRIHEIMSIYRDARLDFVDCCIMALAERLNIVEVCTFDQRDFTIFRPKHIQRLEILP